MFVGIKHSSFVIRGFSIFLQLLHIYNTANAKQIRDHWLFSTDQKRERKFLNMLTGIFYGEIDFHTSAHEKRPTICILLAVSQKYSWLVVSSTMMVQILRKIKSKEEGPTVQKLCCPDEN